jgi:hypothetical protein
VTEYIVKLTYLDGGAAQKAVRDADKIRGALGPLESLGGRRSGRAGSDPAVTFLREREKAYQKQQRADVGYTRFWERETARRERAQQKAEAASARERQRFSAYRIRIDRAERAEKERAQQKETAALAREEARRNRIADQAARLRARAHERAAHKSYFGGEKSIGGLLRKRAANKASGLATGAADALLAAPGQIVTGAAGAVGAIAVGTATIAYNFGKAAIAAQAMREESVEGFTAIFGSATEANRLFDVARVAAKQTKFDTADVVRDFNTIAAAGFKSDQIERVYWSSADIGSARGGGKQQSYLNALSKINASPQASFGSVQQAALAGPGIGNVFDELSKRLGINQTLSRKDWMKKFRSGEVSGSTALESVIGATNKLYNSKTGQPGEYAKGQGDKTWSGVISNIKNGLGDVLNMKLPADHAMNRFKTLLQAIGSSGGIFNETTQRGQRFARLISNVIEDIFMPFGGVTLSNANNIMDKILEAAESLQKRFHGFMLNISKGVDSVVKNAKATLIDLATEIGVAVGKGIYDGVKEAAGIAAKGAWNAITTSWTDLGDAEKWQQARDEVTGGVSARTPDSLALGGDSRRAGGKFYSGDLTTGEPVPSMASGGIVPGPPGAPKMVQMHGGEVVPGLRGEYMGAALAKYGGRGSGMTINIYQTITGGGDPVQTAQQSNQMIEATLDRYLGRLTAQGVG